MKAPNVGGAPSVSASVAGTLAPTSPGTGVAVLMRSLAVSIQTLPLRPVTRGAVVSTAARGARDVRTPIVIGGNVAPAARTSVRVQVIVSSRAGPAGAGSRRSTSSPAGIACVTVVVLPSVGPSVGLETVSVSVPVSPRTNTHGLCAAAIRSGCGTVVHGAGGVPG